MMASDAPANRAGQRGLVLILLQSVIYGLGDSVAKIAYGLAPLFPIMVIRYFLATAILMVLFGRRIMAGLRACRVRDWLLPSFCMGAAFVLGNTAVKLTAATNAAFLRSLSTVLTPLLALVIYHQRFSWKHLPVQAVVLVGLYLLCARGGLSGFGAGEVCALAQALMLAGSLVFSQHSLQKVDPVTLTTMMTVMSGILSLVCLLAAGESLFLPSSSVRLWFCIVYMAVGCTILGYFLQNKALEWIPSRRVALIQCTAPVLTAVFSRLILGEKLTGAGVAGAFLILACVAAETLIKEESH